MYNFIYKCININFDGVRSGWPALSSFSSTSLVVVAAGVGGECMPPVVVVVAVHGPLGTQGNTSWGEGAGRPKTHFPLTFCFLCFRTTLPSIPQSSGIGTVFMETPAAAVL